MKATIYIPDDQAKVYQDAKEKLGESISKTFVRCLERELENERGKIRRIVFECVNSYSGEMSKKAFEGRFIVGTEDGGGKIEGPANSPAGWEICDCYSVAVTKANRLAVLQFVTAHPETVAEFKVFDNLDEFKAAGYPPILIYTVEGCLHYERNVEDLDI